MNKILTKEQAKIIEKINKMSHLEMARLYRFAPAGHIYFDASLPYYEHFSRRFNDLGGMTTEISKMIGW